MKKIILLLTASVFCFQIAGLSQTKIGITSGVSIANMKGKVDGDSKAGFIAGFVLETPIGKDFTFRPSLSYVQKGQKQPPPGLVDNLYIALRYAEFTTDFLYYISGEKGGFFMGAGPSIAFNLPSKTVSETAGVQSSSTIKFGDAPTDNMKGTDWGANFTLGWRTNGGFLLSANYNKGFKNLVVEGDPGSLKNQYIGIRLGVFLNNGK
jgi:hypothetical protein